MNPKPETSFPNITTKLPAGYREATIADFHNNGVVHIGMPFVLYSQELDHYESYTTRPNLTAKEIMPFINKKHCYVKSKN